ncbi:hypothetical protein HYE82_22620 [Streptomyces sp. BR123]|uniref:hypothetical protein n=1 Tax=Streptomyces sp. BR123 TaxID=2749828 RepID=UPI0015C428F2|nr:hypothetical protein [Streptomyces sp. BR123]NXY97116.1 hypothetical protein [Streptomyces sp. BR123]
MSIYDLLHSGSCAALILACTMAGSYVLLVMIVLICPSSMRGKAARDLLSLHPFSKNDSDPQRSQADDSNAP